VTTPNEEILAYLREAPTSGFAGQPVTIVDQWQGSANLLWRVEAREQEAVLKFYLDAGQVRSRRQYDGHALFAPYGLAPQPLWLDRIPETLPRSVLVYRWQDGDLFDTADRSQWQRLAESLARVHSAPVDDMQRFSPHPVNLGYFWSVLGPSLLPLQAWLGAQRLVRLADLTGVLHDSAQQVVDAALPLWGAAPAAVHGDLRPENLLHSFGAVVLLDWELFGLGDPALEVARFLREQRYTVAAEVLDDWLDAYLDGVGDGRAQTRIEVYRRRLLPLQDAAYLLSGGMKLSAEDRQSEELRANADFLATTLHQALAQAALALGAGELEEDARVAAECAALYSGEITP
jgi:aminoglycoside phosphotransferase (APT) family kinase protein